MTTAKGQPGDDLPAEKECTRCHEVKPRSAFGVHRGIPGGQPRCKVCRAAATAERDRAKAATDPEYHKKRSAAARARKIKGLCKICHEPWEDSELCKHCTTALTLLDHDPSKVARALRYVSG